MASTFYKSTGTKNYKHMLLQKLIIFGRNMSEICRNWKNNNNKHKSFLSTYIHFWTKQNLKVDADIHVSSVYTSVKRHQTKCIKKIHFLHEDNMQHFRCLSVPADVSNRQLHSNILDIHSKHLHVDILILCSSKWHQRLNFFWQMWHVNQVPIRFVNPADVQGGPAKVRQTYIFDCNSATFAKTDSYSQKYYYKLKG